jgi:hypothetical protein
MVIPLSAGRHIVSIPSAERDFKKRAKQVKTFYAHVNILDLQKMKITL